MNLTENDLGYILENEELMVFFGKKNSQIDNLKSAFPEFKFHRTKQVHSDKFIQTNADSVDYSTEADAQYSKLKSTALCSITADCIPVLIFNPHSKSIAAIHAGWRGVENQITMKTIEGFCSLAERKNCLVFIGPHIQQKSFECDEDVKNLLLAAIPNNLNSIDEKDLVIHYQVADKNKFKVDLHKILNAQLEAVGVSPENISALYIDTFSDERFHSHRRDKAQAGRQISFVAVK